ncbi:MAG TPA: YfiR family protein, partial [Trinickia sp.]|nr:YfiR family protein [Trinickia sp.]
NFTAFTDWPTANTHGANLIVCANPRSNLGIALSKLDGNQAAGKTWVVRPLPESTRLADCNVLVLDDSASAASMKTALTSELPLLVIRTPECGEGPYVILLFRDGDRLRFDVDNSEAARRHLGLSSKLLRLARKVA